MQRSVVDQDVATELAFYHGMSVKQMMEKIMEWKFDYLTASYYLLLARKRRNEKFNLPAPTHTAKGEINLISSPTVHASLEDNLDRLDLEDEESSGRSDDSDSRERQVRFTRPLSPERVSPDFLKVSVVTVVIGKEYMVLFRKCPT